MTCASAARSSPMPRRQPGAAEQQRHAREHPLVRGALRRVPGSVREPPPCPLDRSLLWLQSLRNSITTDNEQLSPPPPLFRTNFDASGRRPCPSASPAPAMACAPLHAHASGGALRARVRKHAAHNHRAAAVLLCAPGVHRYNTISSSEGEVVSMCLRTVHRYTSSSLEAY